MSRLTVVISLATLLLCACSAPAFADYFTDRIAAMTLMDSGKHAEALEAFTVLAGSAEVELQKADALTQAVHCANALKDYDRAMKLAKQISLSPQSKLAQITVLSAANQRSQLIEEFGAEDLSTWPQHVAREAARLRGLAAMQTNNYELAATDLALAARYPYGSRRKGEMLNCLGATYEQLDRVDDALATFRRSLAVSDPYRYAAAAWSIARILTSRGEHKEAIAILETIQLDRLKAPSWHSWALAAMGDAHAAAGNIDVAAARYREVMALEGAQESFKAACQKKLEALPSTPK